MPFEVNEFRHSVSLYPMRKIFTDVHDLVRIHGAGAGSWAVTIILSREGRGVQVFGVTDRAIVTFPSGIRSCSTVSFTQP